MTERGGLPLVALLSAANRHDSMLFETALDAVPRICQPNRRRRKRPDKGHADKVYDIPRCRRALTARHIKVRIARKGFDSSQRLGRHRWVVERTLACLSRPRRLTVRDKRLADLYKAFLPLGRDLICFNTLQNAR